MEKQIDSAISAGKIKNMIKPTILINSQDLKNWIDSVESKIVNHRIGFNPHYRDLPIETRPEIQTGVMYIYDSFKVL
jgi:hypothetical protein